MNKASSMMETEEPDGRRADCADAQLACVTCGVHGQPDNDSLLSPSVKQVLRCGAAAKEGRGGGVNRVFFSFLFLLPSMWLILLAQIAPSQLPAENYPGTVVDHRHDDQSTPLQSRARAEGGRGEERRG